MGSILSRLKHRVIGKGIYNNSRCRLSNAQESVCIRLFTELWTNLRNWAYRNYPELEELGYIEMPRDFEECQAVLSERHNKWYEWAKKRGFYLYGTGVNRATFVFNDKECVLKIPKFDLTGDGSVNCGFLDQKEHIVNWARLPNEVRDMFVPLCDLDMKGRWMTAPFVQSVRGTKYYERIRNKLEERHVKVYDLHPQNIGKMNGRLVMYDYGGTITYYGDELVSVGKLTQQVKPLPIERSRVEQFLC